MTCNATNPETGNVCEKPEGHDGAHAHGFTTQPNGLRVQPRGDHCTPTERWS